MPETDQQTDKDLDELDTASHVNFRDYPSSGLVVIAAISSGLGWMLYKWLGRKRKARSDASDELAQPEVTSPPAVLPVDKKPER
ncbi:hypothetical protein [Microvirga terrestris]|uniref:LPXTG cell wall anchor domain-containing protein n=1 Tax=Microvirga terrestris TaxID=2791024 RepID=A0ABS0HR48_9HYPH|nr:hypothetical protein [Microvirga terrestris]MBF9195692.1 hypothetical protein [Microvirga terrestris]